MTVQTGIQTNLYARNTFPFLEVFHDETLIFNPQVLLLGLLFHDRAFAAESLTSADILTRLYIPTGQNELSLHLKPALDDIPVFRKAVRNSTGWTISPTEQLPYATLLPWMKRLGEISGFKQIARPYSLRYGAGKAFNQDGELNGLF